MSRYIYNVHACHIHLCNWSALLLCLVTYMQLFYKQLISESNDLYSACLLLLCWILWCASILTSTNGTAWVQLLYIRCRTCFTDHMWGSTLCHIIPLVINSLRGKHTCTCMQTDKVILRNQAHAGLWLAHAWFKIYSWWLCTFLWK